MGIAATSKKELQHYAGAWAKPTIANNLFLAALALTALATLLATLAGLIRLVLLTILVLPRLSRSFDMSLLLSVLPQFNVPHKPAFQPAVSVKSVRVKSPSISRCASSRWNSPLIGVRAPAHSGAEEEKPRL
jgi:hypothetical protein